MNVFDARVGVDVVEAERLLRFLDTRIGHRDLLVLAVDGVVLLGRERVRDLRERHIERSGFGDRRGNNEWRACLVDQDRVDLVDDGEVVRVGAPAVRHALAKIVRVVLEIVAQVVEPEFVVGAIRDVGRVSFVARAWPQQLVLDLERSFFFLALTSRALRILRERGIVTERRFMVDDADRKAERIVHLPHPRAVTAREIVVDGDHVHALAGERVQVRRERRDQGFPLARAHLCDIAAVQDHAAQKLHIEVPLSERATRCFAHRRESFGCQLVDELSLVLPFSETARDTPLELGRFSPQSLVRERLHARLESVRRRHDRLRRPERSGIVVPFQSAPQGHNRSILHPTQSKRKRPRVVSGPFPRRLSAAVSR